MPSPADHDSPIYDSLRRETTLKNMAASGRALGRVFAQIGEAVNAFAAGVTEGLAGEASDDDGGV